MSLNPVRAGLVARAEDWPWSSVRAHLSGADDELVRVAPVLARVPDIRALLVSDAADEARFLAFRHSEAIGRPLGTAEFVADLERRLGRPIAQRAPGRKPPVSSEDEGELF